MLLVNGKLSSFFYENVFVSFNFALAVAWQNYII